MMRLFPLILSVLLWACLAHPLQAGGSSAPTVERGFVRNAGQLIDQHGDPVAGVKYLYHGPGVSVQLRENGFSYDVYTVEDGEALPIESEVLGRTRRQFTVHRIDVEFNGSKGAGELIASEVVDGERIFYRDGARLSTSAFQQVLYREVYEGIDIRFRIRPDGLVEYDIVVHPGADLAAVRMRYSGVNDVAIQDGAVTLHTDLGPLTEMLPASWIDETGHAVTVQPVVENGTVGFVAEAYDRSQTLVVDPVPQVLWSTYFGGREIDVATDVEVSPKEGNVVVGYTFSSDRIATAGAHQTTFADTTDWFIARFIPDGRLQWATYYGGEADDFPGDVQCDKDGNIYVCGYAYSTQNIASVGAFQETHGGLNDAVLVKFDPDGERQWATYFGGSGGDNFGGVTILIDGRIVCAGGACSNGFATSGAFQETIDDNCDAWLAYFEPSQGGLLGCTYLGAGGYDVATCVTYNPARNAVYIAGHTTSTVGLTTNGVHQPNFGGGKYDLFVARFEDVTRRTWATYVGGQGDEFADGEGLHAANDAGLYLAFRTQSPDNIATQGVYQETYAGNQDGALVDLNPNDGTLYWGTYIGGEGFDDALSVKMDLNGFVLVCGATTSEKGIASTGGFQTKLAGGWDGFAMKFNTIGRQMWGSYLGGPANDYARDMQYVDVEHYVVVGETWSSIGIEKKSQHQDRIGGWSDGFVMEIFECEPPTPLINGPDSVCYGTIVEHRIGNATPGSTYHWEQPQLGVIIEGQDSSVVRIDWMAIGTDTIRFIETAPDGCEGIAEFVFKVTDTLMPVVEILQGADAICEGDSVVLHTTLPYASYLWSTGDTTPTITVMDSGSYYVEVSDGICPAMSAPLRIEVWPLPTPQITGPSAVCLQGDATRTYGVAPQTDETVEWSGIDLGTPLDPLDGTTIRIDWMQAGVDTVFVTATTLFGCKATAEYVVTIADSLQPTIVITNGDETFCEGDTLILDAGAGYQEYRWSTGETTQTIRVAESLEVFVEVNDGLCTGTSATLDVKTVPPPVPMITGPTQICLTDPTASYTVAAPGLVLVQWDNLTVGSIQGRLDSTVLDVVWTQAGVDTLRVTVENTEGCQAMAAYAVEITAEVVARIQGSPQRELCAGEATTLMSVANMDSWVWVRDGQEIGSGESIEVSLAGDYQVIQRLVNCVDTSDVVTVTVVEPPSITVREEGGVLIAEGDAVDSYQWLDGSLQVIPGATTDRFTPGADGEYTVEVQMGPCVVRSTPYLFQGVRETDLFMVGDVDFGMLPVDDLINANGGHVNEFIVVNVSSQNLSLDSASIDNPAFVIPNQFPRLMRPGDTSRITVRFTPTEFRSYAGVISVYFGSELGRARATGSGRELGADERITEVILQPDRLEVAPGETFEVLIALGLERPSWSVGTEYEATMQWDSRVLEIVSTPEVFFRTTGREDNYFTAKVPEGVRVPGQTELIRIPFRAKLSDVDSTVLVFSGATAFRWKDDTKAYPACRDSVVNIRICKEGGERLLTKRGTVSIQGVAPHPAGDQATVVFSVTQPMSVTLQVIDPLGTVVQQERIQAAETSATSRTLDLRGLPSGPYVVRLQDGWRDATTILIKQ